MKTVSKRESDLAKTGSQDRDHVDGGAMSPTMRKLILSFVTADSERTWDPGVYTRRSVRATRR
jgi:hypothetical protein